MAQNGDQSNFALNLITQFILSSLCGLAAAFLNSPFNAIFAALGVIVNWSVSIGIIYTLFRLAGTRVEVLEAYYQQVPFGFGRYGLGNADDNANVPHNSQASGSRTSIDWEKFFSVEYIRYAGLILVLSSIFAFLFRIEWSLLYKIAATFSVSAAAFVFSESCLRHARRTWAGCFYIVSFASAQFGLSLLFKYFIKAGDESFLTDLNFWLFLKLTVTLIFTFRLLRHTSLFVAPIFLLIAYLTPVSLHWVDPSITTKSGLIFILSMTVIALFQSVYLKQHGTSILNALLANSYACTYLHMVNPFWRNLYRNRSDVDLSNITEQNMLVFLTIISVYLLHLIVGTLREIQMHRESDETSNESSAERSYTSLFDLLVTQLLGIVFLVIAQMNIPTLQGYYGATLLIASSVSFLLFLAMRSRSIESLYTEVMLNLALIISITGMFINSKGTWSAVVFLLFSCLLIYLSFVLGTLVTKAYAFIALTISIFKLYLENSELFDSVSGTFVILIIGLILMVLSYKLEDIQSMLKK